MVIYTNCYFKLQFTHHFLVRAIMFLAIFPSHNEAMKTTRM